MKKIINNLKYLSIVFFLFISIGEQKAQSIGLDTLERAFFVGGLSPSILSEGKVEVNFYSSIYSSWLAIKQSASDATVVDRLRLSEFSTNIETYYGMSSTGRWDIGLRLNYVRRRLDNAATSSPFKVLGGSDDEELNIGVDKTYSGFREIGLRLRFLPIRSIPELTLNGGYYFSAVKAEEDQTYLAADRSRFDLNAAYYVSLNKSGTSYYYFLLNNIFAHPSAINDEWLLNTNISAFVVQRLAGRFVFYPGLSYGIGYKPPQVEGKTLIKTNQQVLAILGLQYEPSQNLNFNISWGIPLLIDSSNLLVDQVRASYTLVSIGARYVY